MKKLILPIMIMAFVLTGCGSQTKLEELYGGLDEKETFDAMIEYMQEEVTYYREEMTSKTIYTDEVQTRDCEYLNTEDENVQVIDKLYLPDGNIRSFFIDDGEISYRLMYDDIENFYEYYTLENQYENTKLGFDNLGLGNEDNKIIEAKRKDTEDGIVLTFDLTYGPASIVDYLTYEYVIDSDGYLVSYKSTGYEGDSFDKESYTVAYEIKDINKKKSLDMEGAIAEIESVSKEVNAVPPEN